MTCVEEAKEAQQGGADRLEVVRGLEHEGLTPPIEIVEQILNAVSIPIRVMIRETVDFSIRSAEELDTLKAKASQIRQLPVSGFVFGFLRDQAIDAISLRQMLSAIGDHPVTFHRAIEEVADQTGAIDELKSFAPIDRVLVNGGPGPWSERLSILESLQRHGSPKINIIAGGGLNEHGLRLLSRSSLLNEFHIGKAARDEHGVVKSARVGYLRRMLDA